MDEKLSVAELQIGIREREEQIHVLMARLKAWEYWVQIGKEVDALPEGRGLAHLPGGRWGMTKLVDYDLVTTTLGALLGVAEEKA